MNMVMLGRRAGCGLAAIALLFAGAAMALEENDVVTTLKAAAVAAGAKDVSVGASGKDGDDITLSDVTAEAAVPRPMKARIGTVALTKPEPRGNGGLISATVTATDGEIVERDNRFAWRSAVVENAVIPSAGEISDRSAADLFTRLVAEQLVLQLSAKGKPTEIKAMTVGLGDVVDGIPRRVAVELTGMHTGTEVFGRIPRLRRLMENLGYAELTMDVLADLTYEPESGTIGIESAEIKIAEFGTVLLSGTASGLPLSQLQSDASPRDLVAGTRIDTLTMRFENDGLVERGLDKQAKLMGTTRQELQAQMSAALPLLLNILGNPDFQKRLVKPATAFLQDPRSITFSFAPGNPVELLRVVSAALNAPKTLPDLLSVDVKAND